jgi:hypothetical protein
MIEIGADLGFRSGATGIRTPDLLHAMECRLVHDGPGQVTFDPPELRIRPPRATTVHAGSLRTVSSLVTSVQVSSPGTVTSSRAQPLQPDRPELPNSSVCLAHFTRPPNRRPGGRDHATGCLTTPGQSRGWDLTQGPVARIHCSSRARSAQRPGLAAHPAHIR